MVFQMQVGTGVRAGPFEVGRGGMSSLAALAPSRVVRPGIGAAPSPRGRRASGRCYPCKPHPRSFFLTTGQVPSQGRIVAWLSEKITVGSLGGIRYQVRDVTVMRELDVGPPFSAGIAQFPWWWRPRFTLGWNHPIHF